MLLSFLENVTEPVTKTSKYTNSEIIFWYCAFAVVVVLFVLYTKFRHHSKSGLAKGQQKLGHEITRLEMVLKASASRKKPKESLTKTSLMLASLEGQLIDLDEKTKLTDASKGLQMIANINKLIKKLDTSDMKTYQAGLQKIINELGKLNSLFITIMNILK